MRNITIEEYKELVKQRPWEQIKQMFKDVVPVDIKPVNKININPADWIQFTVDNADLVQEKSECAKPHYTDMSNTLANINNQLGRHAGNTSEFNFGINGDTNAKLIKLLGEENIKRMGLHPDYILMRLIVKMPGHGVAWHIDDAGSFDIKFPELELDQDKRCSLGRAVRYWFPVTDWEDGFAMQIDKTIISHWAAGDTYIIPWGHGHASSNFGYVPQYTVSCTGLIND